MPPRQATRLTRREVRRLGRRMIHVLLVRWMRNEIKMGAMSAERESSLLIS